MKKICFLIGCYNNGGGTERVTSQIANGLSDNGYEISIISIEKGLTPHFETNNEISLYELNQMEKYDVVSTGNALINKAMFRLWSFHKIKAVKESFEKVVQKINPDLVIAVDIQCYRIIDAFRKRYHYKTIGWEHFSLLTCGGLGINYSRYLATKHAVKLLVLSDNDLKDYQAKYPKAKNIMRLHNPLAFKPTRNSDMNNKVVIAAGRYAFPKNFDALLEAWYKMGKENQDWELRIFGDGEDKDKLQSLIDKYNLTNARLMPYAKHLDEEMDKASIYALSSEYEGWGLVLIEAQAKGLPCVSFNCKHGPSEIITDGVNGYLVTLNDTDEFASKLLKLMKDDTLRQTFADQAQKDLYKFDIDYVIEQWLKMLNTI